MTTTVLRALGAALLGGLGQLVAQPSVAPTAQSVATLADLRALEAAALPPGTTAYVGGFRAAGDGGEGIFVLQTQPAAATGRAIPDGGVIVEAAGVPGGTWRRIFSGPAVNLLWYGARPDGSEDCADLVRRAARHGDVHYPAGIYLQSHVDVVSHRRYFGDGMGRSIIRRALTGGHDRILFGVSTFDFDRSGRPNGPIEHVRIEDLTLDFHLAERWVNRPLIQFRGDGEHAIRDVVLQRLEFVDSARRHHPNLFGKGGGDAWAINTSAAGIERLTVRECVSRADGHQFIAGGGDMRGVRYVDNEVHNGMANGISLTTVGRAGRFEDVEISRNRFYSTAAASVYVGYDFGYARPIGPLLIRDLRICDNVIVQDVPVVFGERLRGVSFPSAIQVIAGYAGVQNLTVTGNTQRLADGYAGGDANFLKLERGDYALKPGRTAGPLVQPADGKTVRVAVTPRLHEGFPWAFAGCVVAIAGGGYYEVESEGPGGLNLRPIAWLPRAAAGTRIAAGAAVQNWGGIWRQVMVANNNGDARYLIGNSVFADLLIAGNIVRSAVRFQACQIAALKLSGNTQVTVSVAASNLAGQVSDNLIAPVGTFHQGAIGIRLGKDPATGLPEAATLAIMGNALVTGGPLNDVGINVAGDVPTHAVTVAGNVLDPGSVRGFTGHLLDAHRGLRSFGNFFAGDAPAAGPRSAERRLEVTAVFPPAAPTETRLIELPAAVLPGETVAVQAVSGAHAHEFTLAARVDGPGVLRIELHPVGEGRPEELSFDLALRIW